MFAYGSSLIVLIQMSCSTLNGDIFPLIDFHFDDDDEPPSMSIVNINAAIAGG